MFPGSEYTDDELHFLKAMAEAQKRFGRLEAGDPRVLAVAKSLGYRKLDPMTAAAEDSKNQEPRSNDVGVPIDICRNPACAARCRPHRRGLCWKCYSDPLVRRRFPSVSPHGKRLRGQGCDDLDFDGPAPEALEPTAFGPGTPEKEQVLAERADDGVQLHRQGDATESPNGRCPQWRIELPSGIVLDLITAPTKSEARSLAKRRLKLIGQALPPGTIVTRVKSDE